MIRDDKGQKQAAELRQRAEEIALKKTVSSSANLASMSPEDIQRIVHELQVHQIELEVQNEELLRTQTDLDAQKERYFDLYDLAPVGYCTISEKGLILEANLTASTLLGVVREALIRQPISRFILKEDQDIFYHYQKQLHQTGELQACQLRMVKENRTIFWGHLESTVKQDESGTQVCRIVLIDISEKKFKEDMVELTTRLIAQINTPDVLRQRMSSLTASLQKWSGCEAVGIRLKDGDDYPYYETRGFPAAFVEAETHLCIHKANGEILRDSAGNPVLECMCGNILSGRFDPAKPFFTANGSFWSNNTTALLASTTEADRQARTRNRCNGEGYESVALVPLRIDHHILGLLQFNDHHPDRFSPALISHFEKIADIIAIALWRHQAEEHLRESEEKFRTVANHIHDWEYWRAPDGSLVYISPSCEEITGYSSEEFSQNPGLLISIIHPDDRRNFRRHVHDFANSSEKEDYQKVEFRILTRNGEERLIEHNCKEVFDLEGQSLGRRISNRDITERKLAEQEREKLQTQLSQAQKMESVGRLAGGVAHDFNNMLSVILGYTELVMEQVDPSGSLHQELQEIYDAGKRSADITQQLLAFARKQTITPKILDLNDVLEGMLKMLRRLIGEDIALSWLPGSGLGKIKMDPSQLDQLLANLCVNSRDAIKGVGNVTVQTGAVTFDKAYCIDHKGFAPGNFLLLTVSDDGCGMDKEIFNKIFEPFFTTKEVGKGTGLGLATVYGIVKQNNGFVNVYSEPGHGTTFNIYLPVYQSDIEDIQTQTITDTPSTGDETILIVEDDPAVLKLGKTMLESLGYTVLTSNTPLDAIRLAEANASKIHLAITDVVMPEMNGRDLSDRLHILFPDIKTLFMSGYTANIIAHRGILDEGVRFIHKPFSIKDLAVKVRETLHQIN